MEAVPFDTNSDLPHTEFVGFMAWADEGIECYVCKQPKQGLKPFYRIREPGRKNYYTSSKSEYDSYPAAQRKQIVCYLDPKPSEVLAPPSETHAPPSEALVELYHLHNPTSGDHLLTVSEPEMREYASRNGWKYLGIEGYVMLHEDPDHKPLFRAHNELLRDQLYTTNIREVDKEGPSLKKKALEDMLKEQLSGYCRRDFKIYTADDEYFCTTGSVAKFIIHKSRIDRRDYRNGAFDCDDFAHILKSAFIDDIYYNRSRSAAYAFGILWGKAQGDSGTFVRHAVNFVVTSKGCESDFQLWIIEPKEGRWYLPSKGHMKGIWLAIC